ncbi:MAG: hypothetical protein MJA29_05380, partial [Candidatus Omnitrophica bacterium]|nr:hypothetical protein [Candidatus Omnitrophota bacterium]
MKATQPQFLYWYETLESEHSVLEFVREHSTADFKLYLEVLEQLIPWVYALDYYHYARCLPIRIRDMQVLEQLHPTIHEEFMSCRFLGHKSSRNFSKLALDQIHEQLIDRVKGDGGAIDLTENQGQLRKHMVTGPEL